MDTVISTDGTPIAFWQSGGGDPLLLVHGGTADHSTTWRYVLPRLERHFTVYRLDRRGRGASGDSQHYSLQQEAEDIAVLVDRIGQPVNLLGHSYGALCGLEAALLTPHLGRLILYEGVPRRGADYYPPGLLDRFQALLDAGDREGLLVTLFRDLVGMPPDEIELLRSQTEAWNARLGNVPSLPRELRVEAGYMFIPERFKAMRAPTLLLVGGASLPSVLADAQAVEAALPEATITIMMGQGHAAMYAAPDLFVDAVLAFLHTG
jgi:pimeloyl-ACP methyl ester carboxylesterase